MGVITLTSHNITGGLIATGHLVVDRPFDVPAGQSLIWHIDRKEPTDLFDFTTDVKGSIDWIADLPSPNGGGGVTPEATLYLTFGKGFNPFANLYGIAMLDPDDPNSGHLVTTTGGPGYLFRGRRMPSGWVQWSFAE